MIGFAIKVGMTRLFIEGMSIPVTAVKFGQSKLVQKKTADKDGYDAVQIGSFKKKSVSKAEQGHIKKHAKSDTPFAVLEEFKGVEIGDQSDFSVRDFVVGDLVEVSGSTKGRGFTGAVKRYGFAGQPKSHGHYHERAVGSIGAGWPQRVSKGKKMAGHSGNAKLTMRKVKIMAIDEERGLLYLKGSMPGSNSGYLKVKKVSK